MPTDREDPFAHLRVEVGDNLTYYIDPREEERLAREIGNNTKRFVSFQDAWESGVKTVHFRPIDVTGVSLWTSQGFRRYMEYQEHANEIQRDVRGEEWR